MALSAVDWGKAWEALWDRHQRKAPGMRDIQNKATRASEELWKRISPAMGRQKRAEGTPTAGLLPCRGLRLLLLCTLLAGLVLTVGCISREVSSNVIWRDLTITPSEVSVGEKVLIEFWIDIRPYIGVTTDVTLKIDNKDVQTKVVHAEGNVTTRVWFQVTAETIGTHSVSIHNVGVDKLTGTFTVTEPEET